MDLLGVGGEREVSADASFIPQRDFAKRFFLTPRARLLEGIRFVSTCLIGLGSNVGDRADYIRRAVELLRRSPRLQVRAISSFHRTSPVGGPGEQGAFLNAAALLRVELSPADVLRLLLEIELRLGRQRGERWQARVIDLDLLLYDEIELETEALVVPHPRMSFRRFVLMPALEVAAEMRHPAIGWSLRALVDYLNHAANYIAITGPPGVGKTALARAVARSKGCVARVAPGRDDAPRPRCPDSPSAILTAELELLRYRTEQLAVPGGEKQGWILSDFWLDQSLIYARRYLAGPSLETYETAWHAARTQVLQPKLRVLLTATQTAPDGGDTGSDAHASEEAPLEADFVQQSELPNQGPLLKLTKPTMTWATAEVTAAMEAMSEPPA